MADERVTLELTRDEALVLLDWLAATDFVDPVPAPPEAERIAIWKLEAQLEKTLVEPFAENYAELLAAARRRLLG